MTDTFTPTATVPARDWKARLASLLSHPACLFLGRLILGGVFIWASYDKILDPAEFARAIANYKILTSPLLINLSAVFVPWLELLAGMLLILGFWRQGARLVLTGLVAFFSVLITVTTLRGIDIACGCFGSDESSRVGWGLLVRDLALFIPAVLLWWGFRRPAPPPIQDNHE